ncbi:MAG: 2-hydroxyacyl-CoA dehydratase family protein [Syntrophales bacterium]|jgi:bcr-type benzoyl-CoA reductase subunit C
MTEPQSGMKKVWELVNNRSSRVIDLRNAGYKVMGYICIYPPVELLTAFDLIPYRLFGDSREAVTEADRVLTPVVCPFLRSIIDLGMKGRFDFLDGMIGAHTCDIGSVAVHLWRDYVPSPSFVHFLDVPHTDHQPAIQFFEKQIRHLAKALENFTGRSLSVTKLNEAISLHNRQRTLVRDLYNFRKSDPPLITGTEIQAVLMAVFSLPVREGNQLLEAVIGEIGSRVPGEKGDAVRLMLWGSVLDDIHLFEAIEEGNARVVIDDTCVGTRAFWADVGMNGDPFAALTHRYLVEINCPRTYRQAPDAGLRKNYEEDIAARYGYLIPLLREWHAEGVILQSVLYCDTHGYEIPHIARFLDGQGIPHLYLEHDYSGTSGAQIRNRLEAFIEMVQAQRH